MYTDGKIQQNMSCRFLEILVFLGVVFYAAPCRSAVPVCMSV